MNSMREAWTDERLDDLNHRLDEGFRRIDGDLRALRIETKTELTSLRGEMNDRFSRVEAHVDGRFDRVDARFDTLQRTMLQTSGVMIAALIGLIATQL